MTVAALVAAVASGGIVLPHVLALQRAEPATAMPLWARGARPAGPRRGRNGGRRARPAASRAPAARLRRVAVRAPPPVAGHAAAALGGLALAASLLWALARVAQAALAVRRLVRTPLGRGPEGASSWAATTSSSPPPASPGPRWSSPPGRSRASTTPSWRPRSRTSARTSAAATATCCSTPSCAACSAPAARDDARRAPAALPHRARRPLQGGPRRADRLALASAICKAATGATRPPAWPPWAATGRRRACAAAPGRRPLWSSPRPARPRGGAWRRPRWPPRCRCRRWSVAWATQSCSAAVELSSASRWWRSVAFTAAPRGGSDGGPGRRRSSSAARDFEPSPDFRRFSRVIRTGSREDDRASGRAGQHSLLLSMTLFASRGAASAGGRPSARRPPPPALDLDRDDGPARRRRWYCGYFAISAARAGAALAASSTVATPSTRTHQRVAQSSA